MEDGVWRMVYGGWCRVVWRLIYGGWCKWYGGCVRVTCIYYDV